MGRIRLCLIVLLCACVCTLSVQAGPHGRGNRGASREGKLKVGDQAPDATLKRLNGQGKVTLSARWSEKPVVLVFGSYT